MCRVPLEQAATGRPRKYCSPACQARAARRRRRAKARLATACAYCGGRLPEQTLGRPRLFCSRSCRDRAYRQRALARTIGLVRVRDKLRFCADDVEAREIVAELRQARNEGKISETKWPLRLAHRIVTDPGVSEAAKATVRREVRRTRAWLESRRADASAPARADAVLAELERIWALPAFDAARE